jgi:hypothetical protein
MFGAHIYTCSGCLWTLSLAWLSSMAYIFMGPRGRPSLRPTMRERLPGWILILLVRVTVYTYVNHGEIGDLSLRACLHTHESLYI